MGDEPKTCDVPKAPDSIEPSATTSSSDVSAGTEGASATPESPTSVALRATNTMRAYASDWRSFVEACEGTGVASLPATRGTVIDYLCLCVKLGMKRATIKRRITALKQAHRAAGHAVSWGTTSDIFGDIRAQIPDAFAREDALAARTVADERADTLALLEWLQGQAPPAKNAFGYAMRVIRGGEHIAWSPAEIHTRVTDLEGPGQVASTTCDICGATIMTGRCASDEECAKHRCFVAR